MKTVYLIHLDAPLGEPDSDDHRAQFGRPPRKPGSKYQSQHYIGYTKDLDQRLEEHKAGQGSYFLRAAARRGIPWRVVRTWNGGRQLERRIKNRKENRRLCPVCNPDGWDRLAAKED